MGLDNISFSEYIGKTILCLQKPGSYFDSIGKFLYFGAFYWLRILFAVVIFLAFKSNVLQ